jgi:hypothetical protein
MANLRCDWVRQELAEVRRGRASADVADRVAAHLAQCADCQAEADWESRVASVLADATAPHEIERRVRGLRQRRLWQQRAAMGVAAAAVLGVLGLALVDFKPRPVKPAPPVVTEAMVMKDVSGVVTASPVVRLQVDQQQELLLAELNLLAQGDKR